MKRIHKVTHNGVTYTRRNLALVAFVVNNQHVGMSNMQLFRLLYPKYSKLGYPKRLRRLIMQYALEVHNANRGLYADVMGGGWGYTGRK